MMFGAKDGEQAQNEQRMFQKKKKFQEGGRCVIFRSTRTMTSADQNRFVFTGTILIKIVIKPS